MLETEDPDVTVVTTPSGNHLPVVKLAADHGIDVLCEKSLEVTTSRIDRMARRAEAAGIALGGVFQ